MADWAINPAGNLLPAWVKVARLGISPTRVTKLTDRGSIQAVGIVTDAGPFLRALVHDLGCDCENEGMFATFSS
jgi:hypothetical protein